MVDYMNNSVLVSVIVPMYGVEKYLAKCLDSICNQTYRNLEIILVDDGSPDKSGEIAEQYAMKDSRIKVIHQDNAGVSTARNTGIEAATGEYICFSDSDDCLMPDYVEYLLKLALQYHADISLTTEMFSNFDNKQTTDNAVQVLTSEDVTEGILCYRIPIGVYCKLFKKSLLDQGIRFIPEIFIGEGFNFNTAAFQRCNMAVQGHRKIYYYRRDNSESATTKFSIEKWENGLMALQVIHNNMILHTRRLEAAWKFAVWRTHSDAYDILVLAKAEKQYPEFYKRCLQVIRKQAFSAFHVPTSKQNKLRAAIMAVYPRMIPWLMLKRRKRYHAEV